MLVGPDHRPKQLLQPGERKSLTTDRVVLVPGPDDEVRCIREIYRLFTTQKHTFTSISNELNRQSIPYLRGSRWTAGSVGTILHHLKYNGTLVYGRTTRKLYQKEQKLPASRWLVVPHAFEPVVDDATFAAAQALQAKWTVHKSDDQLLGELRAILKQYGRLTSRIIRQAGGVSPASYRHRFGSLMKAYDLIGYDGPILKLVETRRRVQALRLNVMRQLELLFPDTVRIGRRGGRTRSWLNVGRRKVSVRVCLPLPKSEEQSWLLRRVPAEDKLATLVCLADHAANSVAHFFIFPVLPRSRGKNMRITLAELRSSKRLAHLREFQQAFRVVCEPQSRARRKRC